MKKEDEIFQIAYGLAVLTFADIGSLYLVLTQNSSFNDFFQSMMSLFIRDPISIAPVTLFILLNVFAVYVVIDMIRDERKKNAQK